MPLTPETLPRHELTGLPVRVVDSDDPGRVGIEGHVVLETTNTLRIDVCVPPEADRWRDGESEARSASDTSSGQSPREEPVERDEGTRVLTVPKSGSTFEFAITDDAAGDEKSLGTAFKLADTQPDSSESDRADGDAVSCRGDDPSRDRRHAAGENVAYVTVDGSRLLSRPARRTETSGESPWQ